VFIDEAIGWLTDQNLSDAFFLTDLTKDHFSKGGSKTDTFTLSSALQDFRSVAFDLMSAGYMKIC